MSKANDALGRPTDAALTARILAEARTQLMRDGYAGFKIDRLVRAVSCGKSAVYRRYPDKASLAAAALVDAVSIGDMPDTGNVESDLLLHAQQNQANQASPEARKLWLVLADPDVFPRVWDSFLVRRRDAGVEIISRAVARGELPNDVAADVILDTLAGLTLYHQGVKGNWIDGRSYRAVIAALVRHPPRLPGNGDEKENT